MKFTAQFLLFLVICTLLPTHLSAQYWGERVLEKSFEHTDFFFMPHYLSPYGIGSFKSTTPGLLKDPLLDLAINPARLHLDSSQSAYLYTDFRSARNVKERETGYYPPWIYANERVGSDIAFFPRMYVNVRRELEPVFSGAVIARPLPFLLSNLYIGATYQLVMQDEKYYDIPQDIYRRTAGYDYNGREAAGASSMPIVDRYSGEDNMHQAGHFATGFMKFAMPFGLEVGAKLSRVMFSRAGSFGSHNLWEYSPSASGTSLWSNLEARDQGYGHWDAAAGLGFHLSSKVTLGATAGRIWGDATQALTDNDSSYYVYAYTSSSSYYNRSGNTLQEWRHHGKTWYYGADLTVEISPAAKLTFYYQNQRANVDIGLGSTVLDTSFSTYSWTDGTSPYTSTSRSYLGDTRTGTGTQKIKSDRAGATVQWDINERVNLSLGAILEWQDRSIRTREAVLATSRSRYWSTNASYDYMYAQEESKDLHWTFTAERTNFQLPIFVSVKATEALDVLFGLNRTMARWKIDDVTLALFRYRYRVNNGEEERTENFGERYTEPREEVSDIRTTFLAGVTITPVENLKLRLLVVPNFHNTFDGSELEQLQWWIGLTVTP